MISSIHGRHSTFALVVFLFNLNVPFTSVHEIIINMLQSYHLRQLFADSKSIWCL